MSDALTQLNLPDETKDMLGLALALTLYCQDDDKWEKKFGKGEKGVLLTMRKSRLRVDLGNKIVVSIAGGSWNTNCQIPVNIVELSKEQIGEVSDAEGNDHLAAIVVNGLFLLEFEHNPEFKVEKQ